MKQSWFFWMKWVFKSECWFSSAEPACAFPRRRHVNRLCMAAKTPLIESGTAGYVGQVSWRR